MNDTLTDLDDIPFVAEKDLARFKDLEKQAEMFGMEVDLETLEIVPKQPPPKPSFWPSFWDDDKQVDYYHDNMNSEEWEERHARR